MRGSPAALLAASGIADVLTADVPPAGFLAASGLADAIRADVILADIIPAGVPSAARAPRATCSCG